MGMKSIRCGFFKWQFNALHYVDMKQEKDIFGCLFLYINFYIIIDKYF